MYSHLCAVAWRAAVAGAVAWSALAPAAAAEPLSERQLRAALLDTVDLPEGWAEDSARSARQRGVGVPAPVEKGCRALFDVAADDAGTQRAGFARTRAGPFLTTVVTAHDDAGAARGEMAAFRDAAGACGTFHAKEGETKVAYTAADAPDAPDGREPDAETVTVRYERGARDGERDPRVVADVVIARVGEHTVRVAQAGRDDSGAADVTGLARRAVEKLQAVCDGRHPAPRPGQPGTTDL
jgi:hypothetical protein